MENYPNSQNQVPPQQGYTPTPQPLQQPPQNIAQNYPTPKKSRLWLWIILSVVLLGLLALGFYLVFFPPIAARAKAIGFLASVQNNNATKITEYSDFSADDPFIASTSAGLKNATFSPTSTTHQSDGSYAVRFSISHSSALKNAVVTVMKNKVTNLVTNGNVSSSPSATTPSSSSPTTTSSSKECLAFSDFTSNGMDLNTESYYQQVLDDKTKPMNLDVFFFSPDSPEYESITASAIDDKISNIVKFYNNTSAKAYTIQITASTHETGSSTAGTILAEQRNAKVKNALIAAGIPESRLKTEVARTNDLSTGDIDRNVQIDAIFSSDCTTSSANGAQR